MKQREQRSVVQKALRHPGPEFLTAFNVAGKSCHRQIESFFTITVGQPISRTLIINLALAELTRTIQAVFREIHELRETGDHEEASDLLRDFAETMATRMELVRRAEYPNDERCSSREEDDNGRTIH